MCVCVSKASYKPDPITPEEWAEIPTVCCEKLVEQNPKHSTQIRKFVHSSDKILGKWWNPLNFSKLKKEPDHIDVENRNNLIELNWNGTDTFTLQNQAINTVGFILFIFFE